MALKDVSTTIENGNEVTILCTVEYGNQFRKETSNITLIKPFQTCDITK